MAKQATGGSGSKPFDMAYHGHFPTLKALLENDEKLKDQTDEVRICKKIRTVYLSKIRKAAKLTSNNYH